MGSRRIRIPENDRRTAAGAGRVYDGDGNRVSETIGGTTTKYLVDDLNPTYLPQVMDELVNGSVPRTYAYGLQRISENQLVSNTWSPSFYGYDGHGSARFLTNTSGTVTDTYQYDAFGMPITSTGTTANDFRYSGERLDGSIGLYDLRARYYNQATGRFWSADPIETRGCSPLGYNRYIYANDEPVDLDDPTGEQAIIEYLLLYHWIQGFQVHPGFELPFPPCASKGNAGPPKFKGFSTDDEVQMNQAVSHAANKLRNTCCAGPDSPQIADAIENATYVFKPKSKYCGDVGPLGVLRMRHVVTIGPAAFGPGCCSLESTITHEAVHLRTHGDSRAYDVEKKCFGCSVP